MNEDAQTGSLPAMIHIVDDDEAIRRALARLVRSLGMEARTFHSPKQFVEEADMEEVQCLLLDVQLPGMSGPDLYESMIAIGRDVPVIFITAHPDETGRARARMLDAVAYLEKPFDEHCLLEAISTALQSHRRRPGRTIRPSRPRDEPGLD
jgi:FixJ family two-component response regulator